MSVGIVFDGVGVTKAQYQQVLIQVTPDNKLVPGMISHATGTTEKGIIVVGVWGSQEAIDTFFTEQLGKALQDAKITVMPKSFEIFNTLDS